MATARRIKAHEAGWRAQEAWDRGARTLAQAAEMWNLTESQLRRAWTKVLAKESAPQVWELPEVEWSIREAGDFFWKCARCRRVLVPQTRWALFRGDRSVGFVCLPCRKEKEA